VKKTFFLLVLSSLILILLDYLTYLNFLKKPLENPIIYVKKTVYTKSADFRFLPHLLANYKSVTEKLDSYEENRRSLIELQVTLDELKNENDSLRKQLGSPLPPDYLFIPARVIAWSRYLELDIGFKDGVREGMAVVEGRTLIGSVNKAADFRSRVLLLTDEDIAVPAITDRGTRGIVSGRFNKTVLFDQVLQKDPLFIDDLLLTSGEANYPPNLIIGKISHIQSDDAAVYKQATVESEADIPLFKKVFVVERT